jgi:serine phosphatase RsbU (regulator of sigma subunit)
MNFTLEDHPGLVRVLTLAIVAIFLYMAGFNFYHLASVPTDENVFMDPPSTAFIAADIPAQFVEEQGVKLFRRAAEPPPNALAVGDALISVNNQTVTSLGDARRVIDAPATGDTVAIFLVRASVNRSFLYKVEKKLLTPDVLTEQKNVVLVTSVLPGGASDRAGMKPGDLIYRINDSSFTTAKAADKILRQGQVDKSLRYDIYRSGATVSLQVTLAKFGVPFILLTIVCVGLFYVGTGTFLVLKRPRLAAARLIGWGFIALGCMLMTISQGRETDLPVLRYIRNVMVFFGIFGGTALFTHSFFFFPKEKTALLANAWHRAAIYAISGVFCLLLAGTKNQYFLFGVFVPMIYFWVVQYLNRDKHPRAAGVVLREAGWYAWSVDKVKLVGRTLWPKSMMRGVRGSVWTILFLILAFMILQPYFPDNGNNALNIVIIALVLFPLAYLYTIGRYQLLDMSLRIRRNLQYSALTIAWNVVLLTSLVVLFFSLPDIALPLQNVEFTGASILITDAPVPASDFLRNEKIGSMLLGLAAVFGYVIVRRRGQAFIDEKYYQTQFDYRRALSELSEALAAKLGMSDLARGLVTTLADLLKVKQASVMFFRNGDSCCCIESAGQEAATIGTICMTDQTLLIGALANVTDSTRVEYLPVQLRTVLEGSGICIVLPIRSKEQLIGALLIGEKLSETVFKDEDISFLNSAAMQASVSIENAFLYEELAEQERMKHELEIARKIQLASLPQEIPQVRGLDIAGSSLPAMEVGGDFYDYLETDPTKLTVIIGDVSGKGTSAALYMSKVQGILRSLFTFGLSPRELFIRANRLLCRDLEKRSFVTVLGAEFDLATRNVLIARAGHLPLYCYGGAAHTVEKIVPPGIGLGLNDAEQPFSLLNEFSKDLHAGDVYLFVSDGITEAHNDEGEEYGDERLAAFLEAHHGEPSSLVCQNLYADVKTFAGAVPQHDDQTIVCIAITEQ